MTGDGGEAGAGGAGAFRSATGAVGSPVTGNPVAATARSSAAILAEAPATAGSAIEAASVGAATTTAAASRQDMLADATAADGAGVNGGSSRVTAVQQESRETDSAVTCSSGRGGAVAVAANPDSTPTASSASSGAVGPVACAAGHVAAATTNLERKNAETHAPLPLNNNSSHVDNTSSTCSGSSYSISVIREENRRYRSGRNNGSSNSNSIAYPIPSEGHREQPSQRFLLPLAQEQRHVVHRFRVASLAAAAPASAGVSESPAAFPGAAAPATAADRSSSGAQQQRRSSISNGSSGGAGRSALPPLPPAAIPLLSSTNPIGNSFIHGSGSFDSTGLFGSSGGSNRLTRSSSIQWSGYQDRRIYIAAPSQVTMLSLGATATPENSILFAGARNYPTAPAAAAEQRRQVCASAAEARQAHRRGSVSITHSRPAPTATSSSNGTSISSSRRRSNSSAAGRTVSPDRFTVEIGGARSSVPVAAEGSAATSDAATAAAGNLSHRDSNAVAASDTLCLTRRVTSGNGAQGSLANRGSSSSDVGTGSLCSSREATVPPASSAGGAQAANSSVPCFAGASASPGAVSAAPPLTARAAASSSAPVCAASSFAAGSAAAAVTRHGGSFRMQPQQHVFFHNSAAPVQAAYSLAEHYPYFYTTAGGRAAGAGGTPSLVLLSPGEPHLPQQRSGTTVPAEGAETAAAGSFSVPLPSSLPFHLLPSSGGASVAAARGSTTAELRSSSSNRRSRRLRRHSVAAAAAPRRGEPEAPQCQQHSQRQPPQTSNFVAGTHFVTPLNALLRRGSFSSSSGNPSGAGAGAAAATRRPSRSRGPPIPAPAAAGRAGSGAAPGRGETARPAAPAGAAAAEPSGGGAEEFYLMPLGETGGAAGPGQVYFPSHEAPRDSSSSRSSSVYSWWEAPTETRLLPLLRGLQSHRSVTVAAPPTPTLTPAAVISPAPGPSGSSADAVAATAVGAAPAANSAYPSSSTSAAAVRPAAAFPPFSATFSPSAGTAEEGTVLVRGGVPLLFQDQRQHPQLQRHWQQQQQQPLTLQEHLQQQQQLGAASVRWLPDGTLVVEGFAADQFNTFREGVLLAAAQGADVLHENRGLSAHILQWLPEEMYDPRRGVALSDDSDARECNICMMRYEPNERLRRLPCLHAFHAECVGRWLQEHTSCPLCRFEVSQGLRWEWSSPMAAGVRNTPAAARGFSSAAADAAAAAASPLYPAVARHTFGAFTGAASPAGAAGAGARPRGRSGSTPAAFSSPPGRSPRSFAAAPAPMSPSAPFAASSSTSPSAAAMPTSSAAVSSASSAASHTSSLAAALASPRTAPSTSAAGTSASLYVAAACLPATSISTTIRSTAAGAVSPAPAAAAASSTATVDEDTPASSSSFSSSAAAAASSAAAASTAAAVCAAANLLPRRAFGDATSTVSAAAAALSEVSTSRPAPAEAASSHLYAAAPPDLRTVSQSSAGAPASTGRHAPSGYPAAASSTQAATSTPRPTVTASFSIEPPATQCAREAADSFQSPHEDTRSAAGATSITTTSVSPDLPRVSVSEPGAVAVVRLSSSLSPGVPAPASRTAASDKSSLYARGNDSTAASSPAQSASGAASSSSPAVDSYNHSPASTSVTTSSSSKSTAAAAAIPDALSSAGESPDAAAPGLPTLHCAHTETAATAGTTAAPAETVKTASTTSERKTVTEIDRASHRLTLPTGNSSLAVGAAPGVASARTDSGVARHFQEAGQQSPPCSSVAAAAAAALVTAARSAQLLQPTASTRSFCRAAGLTAGAPAAPVTAAERAPVTQAPTARRAIPAAAEEERQGSVNAQAGASTVAPPAAASSPAATGPLAGAATAAPSQGQRALATSAGGSLDKQAGTSEEAEVCSRSTGAAAYALGPPPAVTAALPAAAGQHPVSRSGQCHDEEQRRHIFREKFSMSRCSSSNSVDATGRGNNASTNSHSLLQKRRNPPTVSAPAAAAAAGAAAMPQGDDKSCGAEMHQSSQSVCGGNSSEVVAAAAAVSASGTAVAPAASLLCPAAHKTAAFLQASVRPTATQSPSREPSVPDSSLRWGLPSACGAAPGAPEPKARTFAEDLRTPAATRAAQRAAAAASVQPPSARRRATQPVAVTKAASGSISARAAEVKAAAERVSGPAPAAAGDFTCSLRRRESSGSEHATTGTNTGATAGSEASRGAVPQKRLSTRAPATEEQEAREELCIDCRLSKDDSPSGEQLEQPQEKRAAATASAQPFECRHNSPGIESTRSRPSGSSRRRAAAARLSTAFRTLSNTFIQLSPLADRSPITLRRRSPEATAAAPAGPEPQHAATQHQESRSTAMTRIAVTPVAPKDETTASQAAAIGSAAASSARSAGSAEGGVDTTVPPDWLPGLSPSFSSSCPSIASEHTSLSPHRSAATSSLSGGTNSSRTSTPPSSAEASPLTRHTGLYQGTGAAAAAAVPTKALHTRATAQAAGLRFASLVPPPASDASDPPKQNQKLTAGGGVEAASARPESASALGRNEPSPAAPEGDVPAPALLSKAGALAAPSAAGAEHLSLEQAHLQHPSRRQPPPAAGPV